MSILDRAVNRITDIGIGKLWIWNSRITRNFNPGAYVKGVGTKPRTKCPRRF